MEFGWIGLPSLPTAWLPFPSWMVDWAVDVIVCWCDDSGLLSKKSESGTRSPGCSIERTLMSLGISYCAIGEPSVMTAVTAFMS